MNNPAPKKPATVKTAITPTRAENYALWFQQVVRSADMAEMSGVRGCMILKPWGYGAWELMQRALDKRFKETGHDNCYFPLFIPLSYFQREAEHVEGFAKEMAVVTHHRLAMKDGKLVPDGELEEPLIVRPTSETVIGEAMSKWIQSYRDLPVLLNQWANVVRWEMRPRLLLRTAEFLWQEGHTAHETYEEAMAETKQMHEVYRSFAEECLAVPVVAGEKPPHERFPGAVSSLSIEAMMQDGRALQAGTSHYLGQNFSKSIGIQFQNRQGAQEYVHTTSWGASTRLLGALVMVHADDDGMKMPPKVAAHQIVIIPILRDEAAREQVLAYCEKLRQDLQAQSYDGQPLRVKLDARDLPGGDKRWEWIKKGAPILIEVGPRDIQGNQVCVTRRDQLAAGKNFMARDAFVTVAAVELGNVQQSLLDAAKTLMKARTATDIADWESFKTYFNTDADSSFSSSQGFVRAKWCGDPASLAQLDPLGVTVRCIPFDQSGTTGTCVLTGKPATQDVVFARAY